MHCNKVGLHVKINAAYPVSHSENKLGMNDMHFGFVHEIDSLNLSILVKSRAENFT
jgi:hypothetical protein